MKNSQKPNLNIAFYATPYTGVLNGRFGGLSELFGVHHIKAQVFDDTVILTGANLSETYFTDRQDWYFIIEECGSLADYL